MVAALFVCLCSARTRHTGLSEQDHPNARKAQTSLRTVCDAARKELRDAPLDAVEPWASGGDDGDDGASLKLRMPVVLLAKVVRSARPVRRRMRSPLSVL